MLWFELQAKKQIMIRSSNLSPLDRGSKEETFRALSRDFDFDDKVLRLFMESPMNDLRSFAFYFAEEKEIEQVFHD